MITKSQLSEIFFRHDPMGTQCNVNRGMSDEYDIEAFHIVNLLKDGVPFRNALHSTFSLFFWDGCLIDNDAVTKIELEYNNTVNPQ